ncbi:MAG: VCBS repeat-containing protein [candidate division WOR-3 bacterium]
MIKIILLIAQTWAPGWWPMYGGDAQHTRVQLLRGAMSIPPSVTSIDLGGATESEGPAIAVIGGVSYIFLANVGGDPDCIWAIRYQGSYQVAWTWPLANTRSQGTAFAVWDIDNDGTVEMLHANIYTSEDVGAMWCRNAATGETDWPGWYGPYNGLNPTSPTLYDVDGDGKTEVLFGDERLDSLWCLNPVNGSKLWSARALNGDYAPAVGQVMPGGDPEVVSTSGDDTLIIWNAKTGVRLASLYLGAGTTKSAPAIADVDKDGIMEVFIYRVSPDSLWCLKPSGTSFSILWRQRVPSGGGVYKQGMGIADLNGDGWLDVVIGSGGSASTAPDLYDRVHCFRGYDGNVIWRSDTLAGDVHRGVAIADIDGDGRWEVIAQTYPGWVYCLAGESGAKQWKVEAPYCSDGHDVTIGDTDGDGCSEITLAGPGTNRNLWIIDAPGAGCGPVYEESEETPQLESGPKAWFSGNNLHVVSQRGGEARIRIYDPVGCLVISKETRLSPGENLLSLELRKGLYVALVEHENKRLKVSFTLSK